MCWHAAAPHPPLCQNHPVTAKQALLERVETMSEEEAEELLQRLDWESTEFEELTPEELERVLRGEEQIAQGASVDGATLLRELNL